ncbi:hypothetical protein FANTH_5118 [Fusarium anthophilum]|uniref:Uncharacterized protein n=1 Tax=Fusarium anthophilum TaxID=48485 RepID=A0A8H4ZMW3_9HYPO|nr:hypothetical protein FANTH_5118 [Fusarium anthophilum]
MPKPDTDEMIQARWGSKQWSFYNWECENAQAIEDTLRPGSDYDALSKFIAAAWPDEKDHEEYEAWSDEWNGRVMRRMLYPWSVKDFIDTVLATNFLEAAVSQLHDLWWAMDTCNLSSVPIGHAKFGGVESYYVFEPAHRFLEPEFRQTGPSILGTDILSMTVKFGKARALSVSSGSPETTHSGPNMSSNLSKPEKPNPRPRALTGPEQQPDPVELARNEIDPNHFVFAQIGLLYVYGKDYDHAKGCSIDVLKEGPWWQNALVVVVRLDKKGNQGAVYVIWHANSIIEEDEADDDDYDDYDDGEELAPETKDHVPGRLHPRCNEGFSLAKIANSVHELGQFDKEFHFLPITKTSSVIHHAQFLEHDEQWITIEPALALPVEVNK